MGVIRSGDFETDFCESFRLSRIAIQSGLPTRLYASDRDFAVVVRQICETLEFLILLTSHFVSKLTGYRQSFSNRAGFVAVYLTVCSIFRCPR
jgi:hypothetical protein